MAWIRAPENWRSVAQVHEDAPDEFDEPVHFDEDGWAELDNEDVAKFIDKAYPEVEFYEYKKDYNEEDN